MTELERTLEDTVTQRWISEWCTSIETTWNNLRWYNASQLRNVFFPKSVLQESYIHYEENKWAKDAFEFNSDILSEEEDDLISVYNLTFTQEAFTAKKFFHVGFEDNFYTFARTNCSNRRQLRQEFSKLDKVYFIQKDSVGLFLKRSCPLIYSQIERWKLLTELKEHSREVRVAKK